MSNDTILREVDEELRSDRLRALWRQLGPWLVAAAVLVVLAVAINEGWRWWQNSTAARSSDQFYAALELAEGTDVAAAQAALNEVVTAGSGSYPTLARFRQASLLARDGKIAEAVAAYDALASSQSNSGLRDLALVLAANLLVDGGDLAAVQQRVGGMATPDHAMRNAAREAIGLTQYKAGDLTAALASFEAVLADPLATEDARNRMQIFIAQLTAEGASSAVVEQQPAGTTAPPDASPDQAAPVQPDAEPAAEAPAPEAGATAN